MLIHTHFAQLLPLFLRERQAQRTMVLATIVQTAGSTYRKAGAQMLIAQNGEYAGLLSGGCLEGDLREHARQVADTRNARIVQYDMRSADDQLFGLGAGCEGAMDILLQAVSHANHWQPLAHLHEHWQRNQATEAALIVRSGQEALPAGTLLLPDGSIVTPTGTLNLPIAPALLTNLCSLLGQPRSPALHSVENLQVFIMSGSPPPRLLVLGAGPDAQPLAALTHFLGWKATIYDHRPAYATAARFPDAEQIVLARPELLSRQLSLHEYQAAVVMSHHLESDLRYLQQLAHCPIPYIGLLGPAARREKLFGDLGTDIERVRPRLHAPVGLSIGAITPEAIALAIISEVHAVLAGHSPTVT
ncbi:MAG: XdhC/CoxI family protein [Steroidobacteraceae bacterium]